MYIEKKASVMSNDLYYSPQKSQSQASSMFARELLELPKLKQNNYLQPNGAHQFASPMPESKLITSQFVVTSPVHADDAATTFTNDTTGRAATASAKKLSSKDARFQSAIEATSSLWNDSPNFFSGST